MDIWYLPTISEYIKLLIKPVICKITPEEATKVLEDFDPNVRKFFLTKGIINLFPSKIQNVILSEEVRKEIEGMKIVTYSHGKKELNALQIGDENTSDSTRSDDRAHININDHISYNSETKEKAIAPYIRKTNSIPKIQRKNSNNSSNISLLDKHQRQQINLHYESNPLLNERILNTHYINQKNNATASATTYNKILDYFEKEIPLMHSDTQSPLITFKKKKKLDLELLDDIVPCTKVNDDYRFYEVEDEGGKVVYKTIIIQSSEKLKQEKERNSSSISTQDLKDFYWDNIEEYYHREAKKARKGQAETKNNFFQLLMKSLHQQIISKIDYHKLSKAFIIFCLTLMVQILISKK